MKYKIYKSLLACCLFLGIHLLHGQNVISCVPSSATPGSTITVTITGADVDFTSGTTAAAELRTPNGSSIYSTQLTVISPTVVSGNFTFPGSALLGDYDLRVVATAYNWVPGLFSVVGGLPGTTGLVSGHVHLDENANCVQEPSEPDIGGRIVKIEPGPYYAVTNPAGDYYAQLIPGNYTISPILGLHQAQPCPTGPRSVALTSTTVPVTGQDFSINLQHVSDGGVYCGSTLPPRPGFERDHYLTVENLGYYPLTGTLTYILDTHYAYLGSNPLATVAGDTITWTISPPIPPGASANYIVTTYLPVNTSLGITLTCQTALELDSVDVDTENNFSACSEVVVGSFDPNDKMAWNQDMLPADPNIAATDSLLIYRIRFQNTGTASAINIFIRDTLDAHLDVGSLRTLSTSHQPYTFSLNGEGNLEWRFPNIELPDSFSDEPGSHGYVLYAIKIKPGFNIGDDIKNVASIYFDFNAPVVTNETHTSIFVATADPELLNPVQVYPNPATGAITVSLDCAERGSAQLELLDMFGRVSSQASVACKDGDLQISVADLPAGIYHLRVQLGQQQFVRKLVVQH